ncbi:AraC family transcriptional regulator [Niastella yeongjuensis]|uniref:AraC family transcriptional regulator n=1 Tax=Niastella yeongjuensis TaxID=354355 RepID=A0A1V9E125_9BACT|nr:helix-turn-helix domain-containing protein [Niastella yeongjuensis]OQP39833.1 AraC family transcriptional regulator [Niastella yeongjuensis]SEO07067.1 AraC-type DNA-binding protein [Niastella yeongjuensis]
MAQFLPSPALQPYIKNFLIIDCEQGMVNRILPDTSIVIAFRLRGQVSWSDNGGATHSFPQTVISGIRDSSRLVDYAKETTNLLVIFKEGGAAAFFSAPLYELGSISVSLDHLIQRSKVCAIEEELAAADNNNQRILIVERFLLSELKITQSDALVSEAIQKIKRLKGDIKIKELVAGLPISRDPFEKRFRKITGTSPKHFAAIVRLKSLIENYTDAISFTEAAYSAGYYDQAHFIKDFRAFTGQTPHDFFKAPPLW